MSAVSSVSQPKLVNSNNNNNNHDEFGDIIQTNARPNYDVTNPLEPISGYTNYTPQEMTIISEWRRQIADVYRLNGFTGIETRPVEYATNLLKKGGVNKQIYGISRLQDGGLTKLALPFDRTIQLAIFCAQHAAKITLPYKRWDIGLAFRGEHASKGRYRAFIQCDNDIIDKNLTSRADAEAIATMIKAVQATGVKDCKLFLNHIVIAKAFVRNAGIADNRADDALRIIDKLKPDNWNEVVKELAQAFPELGPVGAEKLLKSMNYKGPVADFKFAYAVDQGTLKAYTHLLEVEKTCRGMGIPEGIVQFCPSLTRGLDYYTGVVFETFIPGKEKYGSIASGGRYDKLVDGFSENETGLEGVGGSIGLTRLLDVMKEENAVDLTKQTSSKVFVGYRILEEGCYEKALEIASALRNQGVYTELYTAEKIKVQKQLDVCNKKGIPYSIMVMNANELQFKNMKTSSKETFSTTEEIVNRVVNEQKKNAEIDNSSKNESKANH